MRLWRWIYFCLVIAVGTLTVPLSAQNATPAATTLDAAVYLTAGRDAVSQTLQFLSVDANAKIAATGGVGFGPVDTFGDVVATNHFVFTTSGNMVYSFQLQGDLLHPVMTDTSSHAEEACGITNLTLDHTGATLYLEVSNGGLCEDTVYESYSINKSNGSLKYLSSASAPFLFFNGLTFSGNDKYAYGARCTDFQGGLLGDLPTYRRLTAGDLQYVADNPGTPALSGTDVYCPLLATSSNDNYLAVALQEFDFNDPSTPIGLPRIASYGGDQLGMLTTDSTARNMATTMVTTPQSLALSPTARHLAVGGTNGLQLFIFNGASHLLQYSNLLTTDEIDQVAWDRSNHLYALSHGKHALHVYTVTSAGVTEGPNSPFAVDNFSSMSVVPLVAQAPDQPEPYCQAATPGVVICTPLTGKTLKSPVYVSTGAMAANGHLSAIRIYVDTVPQALITAVFPVTGFGITQALGLSKGTHHLTVVGYQTDGGAQVARETVTVQ